MLALVFTSFAVPRPTQAASPTPISLPELYLITDTFREIVKDWTFDAATIDYSLGETFTSEWQNALGAMTEWVVNQSAALHDGTTLIADTTGGKLTVKTTSTFEDDVEIDSPGNLVVGGNVAVGATSASTRLDVEGGVAVLPAPTSAPVDGAFANSQWTER